jgi:hypothetical protein
LVSFVAAVAGGCGGEEDVRDPYWGYISAAIVQPNCATSSCHSSGAAVAGLNLSTYEDGYTSLRTLRLAPRKMTMGMEPPRAIVNAYNPAESRMVHMLRATGARRMPPERPLAEADIALIEKWILEGAQKN